MIYERIINSLGSDNENISDWANDRIYVGGDNSYFNSSLTPYLIDPMNKGKLNGKKVVTVIGIEQHGKTLIEIINAVYHLRYSNVQILWVYPAIELAKKVNKNKLLPAIKSEPFLSRDLNRKSVTATQIHLNGTSINFLGSASGIISDSPKVIFCDEIEKWMEKNSKMNYLEDIEKRTRSYKDSLTYIVTTPHFIDGLGWQSYLRSSQGVWMLRCRGCHKHTMDSTDFENLVYKSRKEGTEFLLNSEVFLKCPICGYKHNQKDLLRCNKKGKYIHKFPSLEERRPGYNFGALCSPFLKLEDIATRKIKYEHQKSSQLDEDYDNSWRGKPYVTKTSNKLSFDILNGKCREIPNEEFVCVFDTVDTQDFYFVCSKWGLTKSHSLQLINAGIRPLMYSKGDESSLEEFLEDKRFPQSLLSFIDKRGHRASDIDQFIRRKVRVMGYIGTNISYGKRYKRSTDVYKSYNVRSRTYQADLIYALYEMPNEHLEGNIFFQPYSRLPSDFFDQIYSVQPTSGTNGDIKEYWKAERHSKHDWFDVSKMAFFVRDLITETIDRKYLNYKDWVKK